MKFINKSILITTSIVAMLLVFSCRHNHSEEDGHNHGKTTEHSDHDGHNHGDEDNTHSDDDGHEEEHEEGEIHLTKEQIETMNIQFGDFTDVKINDFIKATGTLGLPPNAYSAINAKANGFIKNSKKYVEGSYIKKGVVIAYLENPDFIKQQQEYLEVRAELTYLQQELDRQQKLVDAKAGVVKHLQKLQSDVNVKTATINGLSKQLVYLGISTSNLSSENITERIAIISPMSGYITTVSMHNGMYVSSQKELMVVVNDNHLHLELDIFEKDIAQIKEGQKISYTVPAIGNTVYDGEVHIIGKEFNTENKTVRVHGHLEKERPQFIKDLFVEAKIWLNDQTAQALPESSIIKDGASSYIYVANHESDNDEVQFEPIRVIAGTTDKGFTSVKLIDEIPDNMEIVTKGAYYVYAQSKAGELEHNH